MGAIGRGRARSSRGGPLMRPLPVARALGGVALVLTAVPTAHAADLLYVDGDASACDASGSADDPFSTLDCALASGAIEPGTRILVRDAATPYAGGSTAGLGLPSGTADAPIVIEPDVGAAPIFAGAVVIEGVDHWTLRGLVLDGALGGSADAVVVRGGRGLVVEQLRILDWPDRAIVVGGSGSTQDVVLRGNVIARPLGHAMWILDVEGVVVEGNDISDIACETVAFTICTECGPAACFGCGDCLGAVEPECTATASYELGARIGIRVLGDATDVELVRNVLHDFADEGCGADWTRAAAIYVTDTGAVGGRIHHNEIARIAPGASGEGIVMFQSAPDWVIERNIVHDVGACALCEGDFVYFGGVRTRWVHNTVVGAEVGIDVKGAEDLELVANLVSDAEVGVRIGPDAIAGERTFSSNVYDVQTVGMLGDDAYDLPGWQGACDCDGGARVGAPGFDGGDDFTPAPGSAAEDLDAAGAAGPFHGQGPDAGALEAPRALAAAIEVGRPDVIAVDLENRVAPPLSGVAVCAGMVAEIAGQAVTPVSCEAVGDERLHVMLPAPVDGGAEVVLRYEGTAVVDGSRIGGRIGARLAPVQLAVDNAAPPSGATPGTTTGGTAEGDDGGPGADPPDDGGDGGSGAGADGCGCRQSRDRRGGPTWPLLAIAIFGARLRAHASTRRRASR